MQREQSTQMRGLVNDSDVVGIDVVGEDGASR
jgi:hypothetical protein